jgi:RecB family exonuclease
VQRWNQSKLATLARCGEQFRLAYIEGENRGANLRMKRGTAVHAAAALAHRRMLEARNLVGPAAMRYAVPGREEAEAMAADTFDREIEQSETIYERADEIEGTSIVRGRAKDDAIELAGFYVEDVAPDVRPLAVERRIVVTPRDMGVQIFGTMDLVDELPGGAGEQIVDLKTSERKPKKNAADDSDQLTMYSMLRGAETGTTPERVRLDYLVRTPKGDESLVRLESWRSSEHVASLVERLNTAIEAVEKGVFVPAAPDSWACSERWCSFFRTCRYTRGRR